jgi:hypothetical protein
VPDHTGIRRLTLADLDDATLVDLIRHGEGLLVELKRELPAKPKFGAAVASFANALGGWLLLGIADDRSVHGYEPPAGADLQSHLASVLRAQVDPLPPFVCEMRVVDEKPIGVMRIFPSADSPHIVRGTGAVYVRTSKGKEPVDDHQTLLSLARRGEEAERSARERLARMPVINGELRPPDAEPELASHRDSPPAVRYLLRAAPVTVTPALTAWPLTRQAADTCAEVADILLPATHEFGHPLRRQGPEIRPHGRAVAAQVVKSTDITHGDSSIVIADSGGVFAIQLRRGTSKGKRPTVLLQAMVDENIRPLVHEMARLLSSAEAIGRVVMDMWLIMPRDGQVYPGDRPMLGELHVAGELVIPAGHDEAEGLTLAWHREIQRSVGIIKFEGEAQ